jgi:hypothetical protein
MAIGATDLREQRVPSAADAAFGNRRWAHGVADGKTDLAELVKTGTLLVLRADGDLRALALGRLNPFTALGATLDRRCRRWESMIGTSPLPARARAVTLRTLISSLDLSKIAE